MLDIAEAQQRAADVGIPDNMAELSVFRIALHQPGVASGLSNMLQELLWKGQLDARLRELIIMRIGWATDAVYEWTQHWRVARMLDVPERDLLAVRDWRNDDQFGDAERAVLAATDDTLEFGTITDETWAACRAVFDDDAVLVEMVAAIGNWRLFSALLKSLDVPLEEGIDPWPPSGDRPPAGSNGAPVVSTQGWTFSEIWEAAADQIPDAAFAKQGDRTVTWSDANRRAEGLATALLDSGAERQDKVAQYMYNCPEFLETFFACFKASLVPVNTNYRYEADELVYLWDNADAVAVVFHGTFVDTIEAIRDRVPRIRTWIWVDDGTGPCPDWAVAYEDVVLTAGEPVVDRVERSGDDLYMLYTGGTTGMPKGVMWRQDDLINVLGAGLGLTVPEEYDPAFLDGVFVEPGPIGLPACPLMHGTGALTSFGTLTSGGCIVCLESRHFDPAELLDTIDREKVNAIAIVGDAFAKPILDALDAEPGRWTLDSVMAFTSSGVMWSEETKQGMLRHQPNMLLADAFSSSEALGMGQSVSGGGASAKTARFQAGENTIVVDDAGNRVAPGSDSIGRLAVGGRQPIGYYKDPEKSARTFLVVDGKRYSCPGDYATIDADGTVSVLGRGSVCINSGGEKIFPEEVEEALKTHPGVVDAVVVGVPHARFGEMVVGVIQPASGADPDSQDVIEHVRGRLAAYKAPRRIVTVGTIGRAANGKVDYKRLREQAMSAP